MADGAMEVGNAKMALLSALARALPASWRQRWLRLHAAHPAVREPSQIRRQCAKKLERVETSPQFRAVVAYLLDENWTAPQIVDFWVDEQERLVAETSSQVVFEPFLHGRTDLIENLHGLAKTAGLDGDEVGYLVGQVAEIRHVSRGDAELRPAITSSELARSCSFSPR
jgi:hypothetical protein